MSKRLAFEKSVKQVWKNKLILTEKLFNKKSGDKIVKCFIYILFYHRL